MEHNYKTDKVNEDYSWMALIITIGVAFRAAAINGFSPEIVSDSLSYVSMALNLIERNEIVDNMGNYAMYSVGYPLFVLAPVFFVFGKSIIGAQFLHLILGGISIAICYMVAKEAGAGRCGRLLAAIIWALYLPASVYGVYIAKENLMVPLMLGIAWCALRLLKGPSPKVAIGCGILLGLIALTGNAALSLVGSVIFALLLTPASLRQRLKLFVLIFVTTITVVAPWIVRNMEVIEAPVLNTNGGFNLYLGNNPAATGWFVSIADTPRGSTWEALRKTGEFQASNTLKWEAIAWIKTHPAKFLSLAFKKAAYFWTPPFHKGKVQVSTAETAVRFIWLIQFIVLTLAALGSLFFSSLRNRQLAILWLAIVGYTAVHMLFYVIFRYRLPIMPLLGVVAALAIEAFLMKIVLIKNHI